MTRRSAIVLVAVGCVDLGAAARFLERGFAGKGASALLFEGFDGFLTLLLLVLGSAAFLSAAAVSYTHVGRSGALRTILCVVHVGFGAFLVLAGAGSGLIVGGTVIPMADWFLIAPSLGLIAAGALPLIVFRSKA